MSESPGNVYLGRHMSITSERLVRYEGFLGAVDGKNHTVTLNRVRCFGTEDRPVEHKIDPVQETFAEITFSAANIQEMHLMPTLDETKSFVLSADPAVMSIGVEKPCPPYSSNNSVGQNIGHERKHTPAKDNWRNGLDKSQFYAHLNKSYNGLPWNNSGEMKDQSHLLPVTFRRPEPFKPREYVRGYVPKLLREALVTEAKQESPLSLFSLAQELSGNPAFSSSDTDSGSIDQDGCKGSPYGRPFGFPPKNDYVKSQFYGKPRFCAEQFVAHPGQQQDKFPQKVAKFNADYDFETANRMFKEIAIGDPKDIKDDKSEGSTKAKEVQLANEDVKENKVFYKKSAFFDDISSDDKDRRSGKDVRPDWHTQRKTDGETFGPGAQEVISRHARHNNDPHQRQAHADVAAQ